MITDAEKKSDSQTTTLKDILTNFTESNSPVFQRVLNLVNEVMLASIHQTKYCEKLSNEEKEQLSRELTASLFDMILNRFTKKL